MHYFLSSFGIEKVALKENKFYEIYLTKWPKTGFKFQNQFFGGFPSPAIDIGG
jgi:hypothetical protein